MEKPVVRQRRDSLLLPHHSFKKDIMEAFIMDVANHVSIPTGILGTDANDNINVTLKAIGEVRKIKAQNNIPEEYGLRVGVKGGGCSGMSYTLGYDAAPRDNDRVLETNDMKIFIDSKSIFYLMGITLDYTDGLMGRGFTFNNPNATKTCGCGSSFGV